MRPRRILGPLLVLIVVLLACATLLSFFTTPDLLAASDDPRTAEEAIRRAVCAPDAQPIEFNERTTRRLEDGVQLTYDSRCVSSSGKVSPRFAGHVTVQRLARVTIGPEDDPIWGSYYWHAVALPPARSEDALLPGPAHHGDLVGYGAGGGGGGSVGNYAAVRGRVLAPERVAAVEAVFDNGRAVREPTDRDVFVIIEPGANELRELRVLGSDGRVVQTIRVPGGQ